MSDFLASKTLHTYNLSALPTSITLLLIFVESFFRNFLVDSFFQINSLLEGLIQWVTHKLSRILESIGDLL